MLQDECGCMQLVRSIAGAAHANLHSSSNFATALLQATALALLRWRVLWC